MEKLLIITASHNSVTLEANLKNSAIVKTSSLIVAEDYANVPKSFKDPTLLSKMVGEWDMIMYVHEDVYLPQTFESDLKRAVKMLPSNWGVLGSAGVRYQNGGRTIHGYINDRGRVWGKEINSPIPVQTLDELLLIVNPKAGLQFDEQFPLDMYGADICMQSHEKGFGVYVIPGYVHHNSSRPFGGRTPSFFESVEKFKIKWASKLPVATTCTIVK